MRLSWEFTQGKPDEEIAIVKNDISKIKSDMQVLEDDLLDPNKVSKKLIELEDRSRRNNLRFDGLTKDPNDDLGWLWTKSTGRPP